MKNSFNILIVLSLLLAMMSACVDVIDVKLDEEDLDLVVVEAYITTKAEDNVSVRMQRTTEVDDTTSNPAINNAIVKISDDAATPNTVILEEQGTSGRYFLPDGVDYPGVIGRTYTLTIILTDGTVITSTDYLAEVTDIDSIKVNSYEMFNEDYLAVFCSAQDPVGKGNYYMWSVYINGDELSDNEYLSIAEDELVDGNYIEDYMVILDTEKEDEDNVLHLGDTIVVEQLSISQSVFEFYSAVYEQNSIGSMFSVPPANLPSNLSASDNQIIVGLFSARDVATSKKHIITQDDIDTVFN